MYSKYLRLNAQLDYLYKVIVVPEDKRVQLLNTEHYHMTSIELEDSIKRDYLSRRITLDKNLIFQLINIMERDLKEYEIECELFDFWPDAVEWAGEGGIELVSIEYLKESADWAVMYLKHRKKAEK